LIAWLRSRRSNAPRDFFMHVGTHKTGTTSLQGFMAQNHRLLRRWGVLYPFAGRRRTPAAEEMSGHHNLAWEMNDDPRFDVAHGAFGHLLDEIAWRRPHTAVVSSEDFEYLYRRPEALASVARSVRALGYSPHVVLYVRSQADYAQSLYSELAAHHGLDRSFDAFLEEIASQGAATLRGWTFSFEYDVLAHAFEDAFGANALIVRPYERDRAPDALLREFVATIAPGADFERLKQPARLNEASGFIGVLDGLYATLARKAPVAPDAQELAAELFPTSDRRFLNGRFDLLTGEAATAFQARFQESNERFASRYGIHVPAPAPDRGANGDREMRKALFAEAMRRWNLDGE
jgi:hypothetical protein